MQLKTLKLTDLRPADYNPRIITEEEFNGLKESLTTFGQQENLIVNKDMTLISGHQRYEAMKALGWVEAVCNLVDLDKHQEKKLNVLMNSQAISGKYDDLMLSEILEELKLDDDYESLRLDKLEPLDLSSVEIEEDEPPEVSSEPPVSKLGEIYQLGRHRVMCGDSTDKASVELLMDGVKADMVFTDPPYNLSFKGQDLSHTSKEGKRVDKYKGANTKHSEIINDQTENFDSFITEVLTNLKQLDTKAWYFTFSDLTLDQLLVPMRKMGFTWKSIIIWSKNQATLSGKDYKSRYEPIVYGCKDGAFYGERYKQEDIWEFQRTLKNDLHPTMKPIPLIAQAIRNSSKENESVVDLFLGSGSTLIACEQTDRTCYGMELDPKYVDVIRKRYAKFIGKEEEWQSVTQLVDQQ